MTTIHGCRWEWCRNIFDTHDDLVYHIKSEHLIRTRPMARRDAAAMLGAEGYTPEEIASRILPGYVPATQTSIDDPPLQTPGSDLDHAQLGIKSPLEPATTHEETVRQAKATPPPKISGSLASIQKTLDQDGDIIMPPSSPPCPSPTPSPEKGSPEKDMSIDELENVIPPAHHDVFVPVSSPPPGDNGRSSSVASRTPRRRRRSSSFSHFSSPEDEFTAIKSQPLPESPSTSAMIAERGKEIQAKEEERGRERQRENERVTRRGSPVPTSVPAPDSQPARSIVSTRGGIKFKRGRGTGRGRGRGRGPQGLLISGSERPVPPPNAVRRTSPGLRIKSLSTLDEPTPAVLSVSQENHTVSQKSTTDTSLEQTTMPAHEPWQMQTMDTQSTLDASIMTADRMISQYTHAESDEEDMLDGLKANLDDPDLGLQTQMPYVSQTETQTQTQTQ